MCYLERVFFSCNERDSAAIIYSSAARKHEPRLSTSMTIAVSSRTTVFSYVSSPLRPCYRLFYRVTVQSLYRNVYTNTDNYIACVKWKIKAGHWRRRASRPIDTLSAMRGRIASDNTVALIKNKRLLRGTMREALHFYCGKLSLEGRLPPINIRSSLSRRRLNWSDPGIGHFITSLAPAAWLPVPFTTCCEKRSSQVIPLIWFSTEEKVCGIRNYIIVKEL